MSEDRIWICVYEYAGFQYDVYKVGIGVELRPVPGQHQAAQKERHVRAARDQYKQDHRT